VVSRIPHIVFFVRLDLHLKALESIAHSRVDLAGYFIGVVGDIKQRFAAVGENVLRSKSVSYGEM
jgi:hypothetical protein